MRTFVTFEADGFPDEAEWSENGSPLVPDGRSVARAIAASLRDAQFCVTEPVQHQFYGWAFEAGVGRRQAWCLLQGGEPWLLLVEIRRSLLRRLLGEKQTSGLADVLVRVDSALKRDSRFSQIKWFTRDEYEGGAEQGSESPL